VVVLTITRRLRLALRVHRSVPAESISAEEGRRASALLHHARGNSVLTIGETTAFRREGGIVRLFRDDNRLRLQISTKNMESPGLRISSRLLSLAVRTQ
jgi:YfiR/HmsC-like